ncbi:27 kDa hemolymph protein-like, partial [Teleopsis dalmanni]|uniref:27 kDa hemolymph protein-like n=1 Tax=Teleopsis dalmanni TaxID=139649 RepID=UPI0018CFC28C
LKRLLRLHCASASFSAYEEPTETRKKLQRVKCKQKILEVATWKKLKYTLCVLLALIYIYTQVGVAQTSEADDFEKLKSQFLPKEYAKTNFTFEDAKRLLRLKCKKAGVNKAEIYEQLELAATKLVQCVNSVANLTEILQEVEAARPAGELDVVFQKYCNRQPRAEQCLREFNSQLLPCLNSEERSQNAVMMRIVTSLLNFICYKNGDQIAMFIAEEGPECVEANKDNILNCMNATFSAYMPKNGLPIEPLKELPDLVLDPKQCINFYDFEECVIGYLEKCNEITPANVVESMFRYVKNETKCQVEIDKVISVRQHMQRNDGVSNILAKATILSAVVVTLLLKYI